MNAEGLLAMSGMCSYFLFFWNKTTQLLVLSLRTNAKGHIRNAVFFYSSQFHVAQTKKMLVAN